MKIFKRYPKTVYIGNETWKLKFKKLKDEADFGYCDPEDKVIVIRTGMSPRETFKTIIHELLHAFEYEHGIEIKHKSIYKLETAIYDFIVDNLSQTS